MTRATTAFLVATVLGLVLGGTADFSAAEGASNAGLTASLRAAEESFARTMADRDHAAFTAFLDAEAVFFARAGELRGREAVAADWQRFFTAPEAPFSWRPDTAAVLDSGTLGLTSGPVFDPSGRRVGTFNAIWRRQADGSWRIIFDKGCPDCDCPPAPAAAP
jgi:ketosteroid isomerase-like protein